MTSEPIGGAPGIEYRADVDGLRAVAILAVLAFHALPQLVPGGFVGVDIFFVISGYLISGLILAELKSGHFSYAAFYQRRIRRLFPALILVLLATWLLGLLALLPVELAALGKHMIAAAAFAANILNFFEAGYFDAPAITKPLLHLWSLGVEEQFYLVFPVLLIALVRLRSAWLALAAIAFASFALNVALIGDYPAFTFYLPFTRFWEFVAGVLLAPGLAALRPGGAVLPDFGRGARELVAAAGLIAVVAAIAVVRPDGFPGWAALLPVLGTAAIIGAGPGAWVNRALAHPQLVFIGLISYPLYLWHWPLIVSGRTFMRDATNQHERTTALIAVALAFVLAWLTYRYVEQPIRKRKAAPALRQAAYALAGCLAAAAAVGAVTLQTYGFLFAYPKAARPLLVPLKFELTPLPEIAGQTGPLVATYGDSNAGHLHPGLIALQKTRTFRLTTVGWSRCAPISDVAPIDRDRCQGVTAKAVDTFTRLKPDIVIIAAYWGQHAHLERLAGTVQALRGSGARVVIMGAVPVWPEPPQVALYKYYRSHPDRPVPVRLTSFKTETHQTDQVLQAIAAATGATFVSVRSVLCDTSGCLARLGEDASDIVQTDIMHLSEAASRYLIEHVAEQIFAGARPTAEMQDRPKD